MKKRSIFLVCLLLIACLTFTACSKTKSNNNNKQWPSISYITDSEKYKGAGEITYSTSFADGSSSVRINNATAASVLAYRTQLETAGWTLVLGPVVEDDNTAWGYTKGEATCSIRLYNTAQIEERYTFNLYIGFEKDGATPPPSEDALATPVVVINSSGLASWTAVSNAEEYKYKIDGGAEQTTENTSVQLTNGQSIQVKAVGDGTKYTDSAYSASKTFTAGGSTTDISLSDFEYQLGNHYYISSRWDITSYDNNDNEYVYQEYRKVALIDGVYFIEKYDYNYGKSNAQGNYSQKFYIPNEFGYTEYSRYDVNDEFESKSATSSEFNTELMLALSDTGITRAKTFINAESLQYVTAGETSTHTTGRTVKKYTYGSMGTSYYDFYVDSQTKACVKFDDYVNDGHIDLLIFSLSGNTWGSNGLPARPDGVTPEPTKLSTPVVTISSSGLASWAAVTNASSYKIKINGGVEEIATGMSEQLSNGVTIQVKAIGDGEIYVDSDWSTVQTYTEQGVDPQPSTLTAPIVTISETGLATWDAVTSASSYIYTINGGAEQTAPADRQVQLTDGQSITVKAVGDGETYLDSAYSISKTYTEITVSYTWPTSTKLAEYGFGELTKPTGSTLSFVGETAASGEEPATLVIVISNGTGQMFDGFTTILYNMGTTYGLGGDGVIQAHDKNSLISSYTGSSAFLGLKPTNDTDIYDGVMVEYYVNAGIDTEGNTIAAQTFIISFAKIDMTSSEQSYADYITLPQKFTIVYGDEYETKTLIKDGDKLYFHRVSEYEDAERLAIKQADGTYYIYEKDNKQGGGWGTEVSAFYNNIYMALEGFEYNLFVYAQRMLSGNTVVSTGSGTVANMTCNVYNFADDYNSYAYYCYNGLVFRTEEHNDGQTVMFEITTYSATGDLSGQNYLLD